MLFYLNKWFVYVSQDGQQSQNISLAQTKNVDVDEKIISDINIDSKNIKCENILETSSVTDQSPFPTSAHLELNSTGDSESTPRTWNNSESPLFEHFLMIGCLEKVISRFSQN